MRNLHHVESMWKFIVNYILFRRFIKKYARCKVHFGIRFWQIPTPSDHDFTVRSAVGRDVDGGLKDDLKRWDEYSRRLTYITSSYMGSNMVVLILELNESSEVLQTCG